MDQMSIRLFRLSTIYSSKVLCFDCLINPNDSDNRLLISFGGTSKQLESAFHITIHQYSLNGMTCVGTPDTIQVPNTIGPFVKDIVFGNCVQVMPLGAAHVSAAVPVAIPIVRHLQATSSAASSVTSTPQVSKVKVSVWRNPFTWFNNFI